MRNIIFFAVILIFSLSSCKFIEKKGWFGKGKADTLIVWQAQQDSIRVADSIATEIATMKAIEKARVDSLIRVENTRLEWETKFKYHIIVGSFLTPEFATDHLAYYKSMGYDAQIVDDSAGRFKLVSAEVHESAGNAFRRLVNYQDTVEFESWVYIKN